MTQDFIGKAGIFLGGMAMVVLACLVPTAQPHAEVLITVGVSLISVVSGAHIQTLGK